jgi:hypothetical protein
MRPSTPFHRWWLLAALGLAVGSATGIATVTLASAARDQRSESTPRPVLDATHLPPLLTVRGEQVDLTYDVHCVRGIEDPEAGCDVRGSVFVRPLGSDSFDEIALTPYARNGERQLVATVPDNLTSEPGFAYYAVLEAPEIGQRVTVPAGGAAAPHVSRQLANSVPVPLGRHVFGRGRRDGTRLAFAHWGDRLAAVGLENGRQLDPVGASAFDVDGSGAIILLDQVHHRLLRWEKGAKDPARVPISVTGTLADMAVADDGSTFVLETTAPPGRNPLVRRFDDGGRELEAIETAERTPSRIQLMPSGPVVLTHPSHHWVPITLDGTPASPADQLRHGRSGRPLQGGREVVVLRSGSELRVALVAGRNVLRSWRLTSDTSLAEVQLAEPMGERFVIVVRLYDSDMDEFGVFVLDRMGLVDRLALDSADWAETAPLSRFRLVGRSLYRLGSSSTGVFVDRFDLEVR